MQSAHNLNDTVIDATSDRPVPNLDRQYSRSFVDRWDELIDWQKRGSSEAGFFVSALRRVHAKRVLDAAAGTGFHSVALLRAGFDVTSVDASEDMLRRAISNGQDRGFVLTTVQSDWRDLARRVEGPFDAIVCLGSSFPHLFEEDDRRQVLADFWALLKPDGVLIVDHRNFDAIRAKRYRSSGQHYYCGSGVEVSIDHVDEAICRFRYAFGDGETYTLGVYPLLSEEMRGLLRDSGFNSVTTFGDFKIQSDVTQSDFVIHVASKS